MAKKGEKNAILADGLIGGRGHSTRLYFYSPKTHYYIYFFK